MTIIPQKRCSMCGVEKPLSEFYSGRGSWCKPCRRQASRDYYWRDPVLQRNKLRQYRESKPGYGKVALRQPYYCSRCEQQKTAGDFNVDRNRRFGHYPFCNDCRKSERARFASRAKVLSRRHYERFRDLYIDRAREWVRENVNRRRAIVRLHAHKRRAWKRGSSGAFTQQEWDALCERYDYRCLCCARRAPEIQLTPDHIIPLSRGGSNTIDNIQPLCGNCNTRKNARTIDYRMKWQSNGQESSDNT